MLSLFWSFARARACAARGRGDVLAPRHGTRIVADVRAGMRGRELARRVTSATAAARRHADLFPSFEAMRAVLPRLSYNKIRAARGRRL